MFPLMSRRSNRSTSSRLGGYESVAVRLARPEDESAIHRVASLDGKKAPAGRVLVAEADSEIIAALAIDGGNAVADPFRWTSDVVALMEMRAEQLAAADLIPVPATGGAVRTALRTRHA
jgi:hypothetical protein